MSLDPNLLPHPEQEAPLHHKLPFHQAAVDPGTGLSIRLQLPGDQAAEKGECQWSLPA